MEPFGEERADMRAALVGARIVAALTGTEQRLDDFIVDYDAQAVDQGEAQRSSLERLAAAFGAEVERDT